MYGQQTRPSSNFCRGLCLSLYLENEEIKIFFKVYFVGHFWLFVLTQVNGGKEKTQNRTGQDRAEQNKTNQNRTGLNKTKQNRTEYTVFFWFLVVLIGSWWSLVVRGGFWWIFMVLWSFSMVCLTVG